MLGGGAFGLGIARELAGQGRKVAVLEKNAAFGAEASGASAGMIGPQSEAMEDDAYFAATLASRDRWKAYAGELQIETGVDLGFHARGAWHLAFGASSEKRLESKYLWQKRRAGKVERLERGELDERFGAFSPRVSAAYFAEGDYWVDNQALCAALEEACRRRGVELRPSTPVIVADQHEGKWRLRPSLGETWTADQVVIAAGAWSGDLMARVLPELRTGRTHPVKGQMLSFRVPPELLPPLPIHAEDIYLVPRGVDRLLVGATVETVGFDTRLTGEGIEWLLRGAFDTIPDLRNCEVDRLWAGLRPGASDGWPTLGPAPLPGLHLAIGAYRRGILLLPLAAEAVAAGVLGHELPAEARAFSPGRQDSRVSM